MPFTFAQNTNVNLATVLTLYEAVTSDDGSSLDSDMQFMNILIL